VTVTEVTPQPTEAERFSHILAVQRAAYRRDEGPSPAARRSDLSRFKAALIARRSAIEEARIEYQPLGVVGVISP
jgi:coniferyl-aldehyde dehydrogenase